MLNDQGKVSFYQSPVTSQFLNGFRFISILRDSASQEYLKAINFSENFRFTDFQRTFRFDSELAERVVEV